MRISDWSSDVCSSDLPFRRAAAGIVEPQHRPALNPRPFPERDGLGSFHVRHISGQENDGRALDQAVAIGDATAVAAIHLVEFGHAFPLTVCQGVTKCGGVVLQGTCMRLEYWPTLTTSRFPMPPCEGFRRQRGG